jgi:hypothetical protein
MDRPKEGYMRKVLVGLLALLAVALFPGVASATHSNGTGPDKDFISGAGKGPLPTPFGTFPAHYEANGQATASGGAPATGSWFTVICPANEVNQPPCSTNPLVASIAPVTISGDLVCVNAVGNGANWRGVITDSSTPLAPVGAGVLSRWVDNGEGANDPPDQQVGFLTPPPGPNPTCPPVAFSTGPNLQGNLVVHDGI